MNSLEDILRMETSRRNTDVVADFVFQEAGIFDELLSLFLKNEDPVNRRAAWVIDVVTEKNPGHLPRVIPGIISNLHRFTHDAMKRHSLRMLIRSDLEQVRNGRFINLFFDWLTNPGESVSAKVYSMEILYRLSQAEPDLKGELADSIEWRMNEESAGFRNRGRKILKKLRAEMKP